MQVKIDDDREILSPLSSWKYYKNEIFRKKINLKNKKIYLDSACSDTTDNNFCNIDELESLKILRLNSSSKYGT